MQSTDRKRAAEAIEAFLNAIGQSSETNPELAGTGDRVASMFIDELCSGYSVDVARTIEENKLAAQSTSSWVIVQDLFLSTTCPHHLMPATGTLSVGYLPDRSIVGIGVLGAVADAFARRLTLQESIGEQLCAAIEAALQCKAVFARIELIHTCMTVRGDRRHEASVLTLATRGQVSPTDVRSLLGQKKT